MFYVFQTLKIKALAKMVDNKVIALYNFVKIIHL